MIFRVCLIVACAIFVAIEEDKVLKIWGMLAVVLMSLSLLGPLLG